MVLLGQSSSAPTGTTPTKPGTSEINNTFVLTPAREFHYEERPVPELRTSRDIRVRVIATGLCGSDVGDLRL